MTPTIALDDQLSHLQSRYIIPHDAPVHVGGRWARENRWILYSRDGTTYGEDSSLTTEPLSKTARLVHEYFREQRTAYQYHAGFGIFYAILSAEDERLLRGQPYVCDVHVVPPKLITDMLVSVNNR